MLRRTLLALTLLAPLALTACMGESGPTASDCDLDANKLSGDWISLKGGGSGSDVPDKFARVRFFEKDGKRQAIYTAGQLVPGKPMTNKYTYEYVRDTGQGDILYSINMFPDKSKQRIERLKKDNRRLDVKFEGRLYVKVDKKRCALTVSDMYVTWVKGKEMVDSNPTGTRTYLRANPDEPPLAFEHCSEPRHLFAFPMSDPNWEKDQPLNPSGDVYKNEPVFLHYVEEAYEGTEEEVRQKLTKAGLFAEDGATYELEMWENDLPWGQAMQPVKKTVTPDENGALHWWFEGAFNSAPQGGIFTEMYRYKVKDGKRELLGATCALFEVEPERTAEEKAEAEAEAAKEKK